MGSIQSVDHRLAVRKGRYKPYQVNSRGGRIHCIEKIDRPNLASKLEVS